MNQSHFTRKIQKGTAITGTLLSLSVPPDLTLRRIWCFYQPQSVKNIASFKTDLVFYKADGQEVLRMPALEKDAVGSLVGLATTSWGAANYNETSNNYPLAATETLVPRIDSAFGMFFMPSPETLEGSYLITPFLLPMDCARIDLVTDLPAVATWSLLACLSHNL